MTQVKYLFIIKTATFGSNKHRAFMSSDSFAASIVGVASVEEACLVAGNFLNQGVKMIDLCSGFKKEDAKKVFDSIEGKIKVSYAGESFI